MLIYESHVFELRIEMKSEVCDPRGLLFFVLIGRITFESEVQIHDFHVSASYT